MSSIDVLDQDVLFKMLCRVDTRSLFRLRRVCRRLRDMFDYVLGVRIRTQSVEPFAATLVDNYILAKTFNEELDRQQAVIQQNYLEALTGGRRVWTTEDPDEEELLLFMSSGDATSDMTDDDFDDDTAEKIKTDAMVEVN